MKAMARQRSHSIAFKRQVAQEFIAGETLYGLSKRHDISRQLIRVWVQKYEVGALDEDAQAADLLQEYEDVRARDLTIVAEMKAICDEFEAYGYRRVDAELRHRGIVVNTKKIRRLMREHTLNPKQHRRFIATTDSDHDYPILPDLAKTMTPDGPNQLWVADITYVAITTGFVYLAAILDAWSRRVVGYAISRSIDARLAVAALKAAISARDPPRGCVHHSDRGSQYASEDYRMVLREHGLRGSMGRRGNPYDNAKAESFMKTLKVEAVYLMDYQTFEDVTDWRTLMSAIPPKADIDGARWNVRFGPQADIR
jgi:putative transposase